MRKKTILWEKVRENGRKSEKVGENKGKFYKLKVEIEFERKDTNTRENQRKWEKVRQNKRKSEKFGRKSEKFGRKSENMGESQRKWEKVREI